MEFCIVIDRTKGEKLGAIAKQPDPQSLAIGQVTKGGLIDGWNRRHPTTPVLPGDVLLEVNGVRGRPEALAAKCSESAVLKLRFRRERAPGAPAMTGRALQPGCTVDFRQVTEICERLEAEPGETEATVHVLVTTIRNPRASAQQKLKALTIANELMYNPQAVAAFGKAEGCRAALAVLRQRPVDAGAAGETAGENIRMLATEVEKLAFQGSPKQKKSSGLFPGQLLKTSAVTGAMSGAQRTLSGMVEKTAATVEKTAATATVAMQKVMQEAEGLLTGLDGTEERGQQPSVGRAGPAGATEHTSGERRRSAEAPQPKRQTSPGSSPPAKAGAQEPPAKAGAQEPRAAQEEDEAWQLQWALNASLEESKRRPSLGSPSSADAQERKAARADPDEGPRDFEGEIAGAVERTEAWTLEIAQMRQQLLERKQQAQRLSEQLEEAGRKLDVADARSEKLQARIRQVETQKQLVATKALEETEERGPQYIQCLLNRIAELEATAQPFQSEL